MGNIKPTEWVINYFGEKIYLTNVQYLAFLDGLKRRRSIIRIDDMVLSDKFTYIVHRSELEADRLNDEEFGWAMKLAEWISRPVHNLDIDRKGAERYSKKLVKRIGTAQVKILWKKYANGANPSVRKFMAEAKEISLGELNEGVLLLEE